MSVLLMSIVSVFLSLGAVWGLGVGAVTVTPPELVLESVLSGSCKTGAGLTGTAVLAAAGFSVPLLL